MGDAKRNLSSIEQSIHSRTFNSPADSERPKFKSKYMETMAHGGAYAFSKDREIETFGMSENKRPDEERPRQIQPVKYISKLD